MTKAANNTGPTNARGRLDLGKDISRRLAQLRSLLYGCYGFGAEWLDSMGEERRDNILWMASDLAEQIGADFDKLRRLSAEEAHHG